MGFRDSWASAFGMTPPDYAAEISAQLPAEEWFVSHAQVIPSAFKGGGSGSISITQRITSKLINLAADAVSKKRHLGGEEGTRAHSLPREGSLKVLALTTAGLSLWDFGPYGADAPGELELRIPRAEVASIADTGERAQGGVPVARVTFADGSFFDYRLMNKPGAEFWGAVAAW